MVSVRLVYGFYSMRACKFLLIISHKTLAIVVSLHTLSCIWRILLSSRIRHRMAQPCAHVNVKMDGQLQRSVRVSLPLLTARNYCSWSIDWRLTICTYFCSAFPLNTPGYSKVTNATPYLYSVTCHLNVNIAGWACVHLSHTAYRYGSEPAANSRCCYSYSLTVWRLSTLVSVLNIVVVEYTQRIHCWCYW